MSNLGSVDRPSGARRHRGAHVRKPRDPRLATERWFLKQGLPRLIEDYSAREDVFTRMLPLLVAVLLLELSLSFGDRFSGWAQAGVFTLFLLVVLAAAVLVNRLRGRRWFQLPDSVGYWEMAAVVLVPALLSLITTPESLVYTFLGIALVNLGILIVGYQLVSFGLVSMLSWSVKFMFRQLAQVIRLVARSLPLLLLFTAFLFLNNEMWQVADDFTGPFYGIILGLLALVSCGFLLANVGEESETLGKFDTWQDVTEQALAAGSPMSALIEESDRPAPGDRPTPDGPVPPPTTPDAHAAQPPPPPAPLSRRAWFNIKLLLFVSQFVRFVLAGAIMGVFFTVFGLLAVRRRTIEAWVKGDVDVISSWDFLGHELVLTWELLAVVGFIATLSGLQFVVSSLTDAAYKRRFFDDIKQELNQVLAVRRLYHDRWHKAS